MRLKAGRLGDDSGLGIVEVLVALVLFTIFSVGAVGMLTASLRTFSVSRERTIAEQLAAARVEEIRLLPYDEVGTVGGNPPGDVPRTQQSEANGLTFTTTADIAYVDDPLPGGFQTYANYKRVVVTVTSSRSSDVLARIETKVAPPSQPSLTDSVVRVRVVDFALNEPIAGATVQLTKGPGGTRTATSAPDGMVVFPALEPNPSSGSQSHYEVEVSMPGYVVLAEDEPPAPAARDHLDPGEVFSTVIRIYKPATIQVLLRNPDGTTFTGPADIEVSSSRGTETFAAAGGSLQITSIDGEQVVPSIEYTLQATSGPVTSDQATQIVPDDYPTLLVSQITLTMGAT